MIVLVSHRTISMETASNLSRLVREVRQLIFVDIQSNARSIRHDNVSAIPFKGIVNNLVEGISTRVALMREKVGYSCIKLNKRGKVDRTPHQVWENAHKGGFGECCNFFTVRDTSRQ